jgi:hypothetical protein
MQRPDSAHEDFINYLQGMLHDSYTYAIKHFERKNEIQRMFDGDIDEGEFGTMSEIFYPILRTAIKRSLPDIVQYVFPSEGFTKLIPMEPGIPYESLRQFERMLDDVMNHKMNIRKHSIPIIQDGLKFGAGYGIVEKKLYTAEKSGVFSALSNGTFVKKKRTLGITATPMLMPSLRYLNYEQVIPYPDASTPDDSSLVCLIDYLSEQQLRDLYRSQEASNDPIYTGNPDEIIKQTRELGMGGGTHPHFWNVLMCAGETTDSMATKYRKVQNITARRLSAGGQRHAPVLVPVVKYFFKNEHVWVANGRTIIFHDKDSFETLRNPILKASPDLDSNNWWAMSDVASSRDVAYAINAYSNSMMDLLSQYLRPMIVYDENRYNGQEVPKYGPWEVVKVNGKVQDAFSIAQPPPLAPGMLTVGSMMHDRYDELNMNPLNGQQTPGLVRGGSHAFESLLQTTSGPRELTGMIYDLGFIEPLIKQVIIHMQTLPQADYEYIELKDNIYTANRITLDDIRFAFDVSIDLREKNRNSISEKMARLNEYQLFRQDPRVDQDMLLEDAIGDAARVRKLIATKEKREQQIKEMQAAAKPEAGMNQAQQAAAGGLGRSQP